MTSLKWSDSVRSCADRISPVNIVKYYPIRLIVGQNKSQTDNFRVQEGMRGNKIAHSEIKSSQTSSKWSKSLRVWAKAVAWLLHWSSLVWLLRFSFTGLLGTVLKMHILCDVCIDVNGCVFRSGFWLVHLSLTGFCWSRCLCRVIIDVDELCSVFCVFVCDWIKWLCNGVGVVCMCMYVYVTFYDYNPKSLSITVFLFRCLLSVQFDDVCEVSDIVACALHTSEVREVREHSTADVISSGRVSWLVLDLVKRWWCTRCAFVVSHWELC